MDIESTLTGTFGPVLLNTGNTDGIITFTVKSDSLMPVIKYLKEQLNYTFLTDICGIHYPEQELSFGVIYHMHNFTENVRVRIKTFLPGNEPKVSSVTSLFPAANWMERETFDFYGIIFEGHPNLKRILNVEYLDYFPMRKGYPLEDPTRHDKDDQFFGR